MTPCGRALAVSIMAVRHVSPGSMVNGAGVVASCRGMGKTPCSAIKFLFTTLATLQDGTIEFVINYELLSELAGRYGVATGYTSAGGQYIVTPTSSILYILTALGVNVSSDPSDEELTRLLFE